MYEEFASLHKDVLLRKQLQERCRGMSDLAKSEDPHCRAEWLWYLENGEIVGIGDMMGFQRGKKAGFQIIFEDGRKALFKPCGSGSEWPENEVRASHLDHALGFNRAPPVVMRNVSMSAMFNLHSGSSVLSSLNYKQSVLNMLSTTCAYGDTLFGATIAWFDGLSPTETIYKKAQVAQKYDFNPKDLRYSDEEELRYLAEVTQNHFFFYLLGTLRDLGYNEYALPSGELMAVDLDRAKWESVGSEAKLTVCSLCLIKQETLEKIQNAVEDGALGYTVQHSLLFDPARLIFTDAERMILNDRLQNLIDCIYQCVKQYGEENVIIS